MADKAVLDSQKKYIFFIAVFVAYCVLVFQFFNLQILQQESYFEKSEQNRIREIVVKPARGLMFDRDGVLVVDNRPAFSVSIIPYEVRHSKKVLPFLEKHLNIDSKALSKKLKRAGYGFSPIKLLSQIDYEQLAILEENKLDLPGVIYQVEPKRHYPTDVNAAHMLGYISEISEREVEKFKDEGYESGDIIGKQGLERIYENYLKGRKGFEYVQVDALGRTIEQSGLSDRNVPPVRGKNIQLTISTRLQKLMEDALEGKRGGAVVLDPRSGEILALVSKPDYDPSLFAGGVSSKHWRYLRNHPDNILLNRAIAGEYPAGSTYKLVSAIAGLNDNVITDKWTRSCGGGYRLGRRVFHCFRGTSHGTLNLLGAIERSCNVYFYQLMYLKIGLPRWARYSHMLGFGDRTGIDLPGEKKGNVPNEAYFDRVYGKGKWSKGLILNLGIGQGELLITPLQMANLMMIIAENGVSRPPHLVKSVENLQTGEWESLDFPVRKHDDIDVKTFETVKEGMYRVVNGGSGTGRGAKIPWAHACGKNRLRRKSPRKFSRLVCRFCAPGKSETGMGDNCGIRRYGRGIRRSDCT